MSTDAPPEPKTERRSRDTSSRRARESQSEQSKREDRRQQLRPGDGPMVVFDNVTKQYGSDAVAIRDLSLSIESGEFVFLVGPSGSGKSTFIKLLIKEVSPTKGGLSVGGRDLAKMGRSKVPYLRRAIGCVFQDYKLLSSRTVFENVAYALQVTGESPSGIRRKVPEMLSLVGLSENCLLYTSDAADERVRV